MSASDSTREVSMLTYADLAEAMVDAALLSAYFDGEPERHPGGEAAFLADLRRDGPEYVKRAEVIVAKRLDALRARSEARAGDGTGSDPSRGPLLAKAREQVAYWRERQRHERSLEDGISADGETYTPIGDVAAWQGGYCNGWYSSSDWWLKTIEALPAQSHETVVAEMSRRIATASADLLRVFPPKSPVLTAQPNTEGRDA